MNFTPGPWFVDGLFGVKASGEKHRWLAICCPQAKDGISQANARLIAAAPMLLRACELFAEYDLVDHDNFEALVVAYAEASEAAHAAIKKATGEQP